MACGGDPGDWRAASRLGQEMRFGLRRPPVLARFLQMWMYLALGGGILVAFNLLIVLVVSVLAQHAESREPRDELDAKPRALLLTHVR